MIQIIDGSLERIKSELFQALNQKKNEAKKVKQKIKSWEKVEKMAAKEECRKVNSYPREFDRKLMELEGVQKLFSSYLPVRVGGLVIDYKTFEKLIKKLKGFEIDCKVIGNELVLKYKKGKAKGSAYFRDMSSFFKDFEHIPDASISYGQEV